MQNADENDLNEPSTGKQKHYILDLNGESNARGVTRIDIEFIFHFW